MPKGYCMASRRLTVAVIWRTHAATPLNGGGVGRLAGHPPPGRHDRRRGWPLGYWAGRPRGRGSPGRSARRPPAVISIGQPSRPHGSHTAGWGLVILSLSLVSPPLSDSEALSAPLRPPERPPRPGGCHAAKVLAGQRLSTSRGGWATHRHGPRFGDVRGGVYCSPHAPPRGGRERPSGHPGHRGSEPGAMAHTGGGSDPAAHGPFGPAQPPEQPAPGTPTRTGQGPSENLREIRGDSGLQR